MESISLLFKTTYRLLSLIAICRIFIDNYKKKKKKIVIAIVTWTGDG